MPQPNPRQPQRPTTPLSSHGSNNPFETTGHALNSDGPTPPSVKQRLGVGGYVSWIVVATLTSLLVGTVAFAQFAQTTQVGGDATSGDLMQVEIQAKIIVGQNSLDKIFPVPAGQKPEIPLPAEIDDGPYEQRLIYASLKNELEGPESASVYLDSLDEKVEKLQADEEKYDVAQEDRFELTENQKQLRESMGELLEGYQNEQFDSSELPEETKTLFKDSLGFAGELFLVPAGTPDTKARQELLSSAAYSIMGVGVFAMLGVMAGLAGFACSIALVFFALSGKLHSRFTNSASKSSVYIETFAIWMSLFFGCSVLLGFLEMDDSGNMIAQPIIFFGSLITLAWPLVRGLSWRQVRQDIGWTIDRPAGDFASAGVSYISALPCLVPGIIFVAIFMAIMSTFQESHEFGRMAGPGHPIQEYIANGDALMLTLVFVTACIAAPIVEETMFRGVLYRHLRDMSQRWARWSSVVFSALLNGFIFAAIHPQGIAGIPVLMTLAICFSLTREWRNSLAAPMLMHGFHNTLVTCVSLLLL